MYIDILQWCLKQLDAPYLLLKWGGFCWRWSTAHPLSNTVPDVQHSVSISCFTHRSILKIKGGGWRSEPSLELNCIATSLEWCVTNNHLKLNANNIFYWEKKHLQQTTLFTRSSCISRETDCCHCSTFSSFFFFFFIHCGWRWLAAMAVACDTRMASAVLNVYCGSVNIIPPAKLLRRYWMACQCIRSPIKICCSIECGRHWVW